MSYNGSGTFLINSAGQPVVANTVISATVFNALTSDLATGLSTAITKDGQTTITNNIPFGSNKITGLGSGTAAADAANLGQVQSTVAKLITVTGTDTITGSMSPQLTAYAAGQLFYFVANAANTGAVTLNIDSLGAKSITRDGSSALAAGDINSGEVVVVIYDGTRFQMINAANSFGNTTINGTLAVTGNAGFQANVSITSALSVGGVFAVTGAATFTANPTLSAGTANGVLYLNGSKVATSGSALTFDGTTFGVTSTWGSNSQLFTNATASNLSGIAARYNGANKGYLYFDNSTSLYNLYGEAGISLAFTANAAEGMRLTSTGLGIGTSSPSYKLHVVGGAAIANRTTSDTPGNISLGVLSTSSVAQFGWRTDTSNNLHFDIYNGASWSAALTTSLSGNLGLGVVPSAWSTGKAAEIGGVGSSVWGLSSGTTYFTAGYYFNTADKFAITGNYALFSQLVPADGSFRWVSSTATGTAGNNATMTERMRLDASGNLGLGVTPSIYTTGKAIDVGTGSSFFGVSNTQTQILNNAYLDTSFKYKNSGAASRLRMVDNSFEFYIAPSGTAGNAITFTQAMTLDASGNLGVGATSPTSGFRLDVQATTARQRIESTTGTNIVEQRLINTGGTLYLSLDNSTGSAFGAAYGAVLWHSGNYPMVFGTNNTERARITAGGYFKASNAASYISSTGSYHELNTDNGAVTTYFRNTNASTPYGIYCDWTGAAPNNTTQYFFRCQDNAGGGTERATIRSNGGLANYQANDVNLSDQRVKKDIKPLGSMWDKFKALEIVTFKYKDQTHDDDNIGVIAQQVESVAPEFIDTDGFGETPEGEEPLKTVYTTDMYHAAIKALQEAMARIEQLEAKVAALEA